MVERCIFVVCLDKKVKWPPATADNKENIIISEQQENNNNSDENGDDEKNIEPLSNGSSRRMNGDGGDEYDSTTTDTLTQAAHQMLHGCNSDNNSGNRWYDKTMQFIISEDGLCGINYEHSPAEGIVVIELSEHLFRYM